MEDIIHDIGLIDQKRFYVSSVPHDGNIAEFLDFIRRKAIRTIFDLSGNTYPDSFYIYIVRLCDNRDESYIEDDSTEEIVSLIQEMKGPILLIGQGRCSSVVSAYHFYRTFKYC